MPCKGPGIASDARQEPSTVTMWPWLGGGVSGGKTGLRGRGVSGWRCHHWASRQLPAKCGPDVPSGGHLSDSVTEGGCHRPQTEKPSAGWGADLPQTLCL